ncbi:MAG: hypothetical protein ACI8TQ_002828 [Planctomycetota bacterium]
MHGTPGGGQKSGAPRRGRWSQAEIARLRECYGLRDDAVIARSLNRPIVSVRKMAIEVFAGERRTGPWSADEVQKLKRYLGRCTEEVIALILRRDLREVHDRILGLDHTLTDSRWTRLEIVDFKRAYGTRTDEDLARIFGRSVEMIKELALRLAMAKDKAFLRKLQGTPATRMPRWSEEELSLLKSLYPAVSNLEIATKLNRSVKSVVSKAHNLRLKKDPDRLREMGRQNVSLRYGADDEPALLPRAEENVELTPVAPLPAASSKGVLEVREHAPAPEGAEPNIG